jgi:Uma2 family endonuclease
MPALAKKTVHDYLKLPEGSPYQLIQGELVMSPAPSIFHQKISKRIFQILYKNIENDQKGEVFYSPVDVYLDEENIFQPDLVVVLKDSKAKIEERGIIGAPDVVIEVLSPSSAYYDLVEKKEVYQKYGVKEYWIVDPKRKTVEIYKNSDNGFVLVASARENGKVFSEILSLEFDLNDIFKEE